MTNLYIIFMTTLVALVSFQINIPYLSETLLIILGYYCLRSYFNWVQFATGLVECQMADELSYEAILISLIYSVGVAVVFMTYPMVAMFMLPWVLHMVAVNAFAVAYHKGLIDISDVDDDDDGDE